MLPVPHPTSSKHKPHVFMLPECGLSVLRASRDFYLRCMGALFSLPLNLDVGCDTQLIVNCFSSTYAQLGILGATGLLEIRASPWDPAPLVTITTTPGAQGGLVYGVTFPSPAGLAVSEQGGLAALGPSSSLTTGIQSLTGPGSVATTQATTGALSALATAPFFLGAVALVTAGPGTYYMWSPLDPSTPNGSTILAGASGGNWLQVGTATITVSAAAALTCSGYDTLSWDLLTIWGNGTTTKLLDGQVLVSQTIS
jgi:hypothetical protein